MYTQSRSEFQDGEKINKIKNTVKYSANTAGMEIFSISKSLQYFLSALNYVIM